MDEVEGEMTGTDKPSRKRKQIFSAQIKFKEGDDEKEEEGKKEEPKREEPKREEPKREELKREELKREEAKREETEQMEEQMNKNKEGDLIKQEGSMIKQEGSAIKQEITKEGSSQMDTSKEITTGVANQGSS